MMYLKLLGKQEQTKPKTSRQREIIKIMAEINKIKTKKLYEESMKQKVGSLKRLTRLTLSQHDKRREKMQINKIRDKKGKKKHKY
jgi:hypothetical protein